MTFYHKLLIFCIFTFFTITISCNKHQEELFILKKVADGLDFPEGPAWNGSGRLYLSNCYGSWIAEFDGSVLDTFATKAKYPDIFGKTNGLTFDKDGNLYACDFGVGSILKLTDEGKVSTFISGYEGNPFNRPNDLAFDSKGNLYFTDPKSYDRDNRDGVVYVYSNSTKQLKPLITGLAFPNGIAFSVDERSLFICESAMNRILKFEIPDDSTSGEPEVFIELPGGDPDGIAFDVKGNLYVAHFGVGKVYKINPEGKIIYEIITPGKKPTNVEFGGPDMRTLYITEAETNALYRVRTDVPGLKLFYSPEH